MTTMRWLVKELDGERPTKSTGRFALLMDAPIMPNKGECALGMEQNSKDAVVKGAKTKLSMEACASSMGQRSNDAAVKGAQIMPNKGECALGMEQRSNDAVLKDAQTKLSKEECASSMGHTAIKNLIMRLG